MPFALLVVNGPRKGEAFPITEGHAVTIGRDADNTIRLADRKLSRIHCQTEIINGRCRITDLNSTNGTLLNGETVQATLPMQPDDELEVGITRLRLVELSPAELALADARRAAEPERGARPTVQCGECGRVISEEELATGKARNVGDRHYCPQCRATFEMPTIEAADQREVEPGEELLDSGQELIEPGRELAGVRIISLIGEGRLGPLYKGEQISMGRLVALKVLNVKDDDWPRKYLNAVYASGQLVHQNIALIFDTGEEDGNYYIVREYVEGQSAQERLAGHRAVPLAEAYTIITQVIHALEHAFERHILHGNLSPRKVLIGSNEIVKVTGFGLLQTPPPGQSASHYSWHALPYTAPERIRSGREPDFASEIYSVSAILYHLLTGRPPFSGSKREKVEKHILTKQPKPLSELVSGLPEIAQKIVDRGMLKDPRSRYQTPREVIYEVEERLRQAL